ncbi:MAG: SDR family NAD(P)-dependent oxidoreductase [Alphaproteobacteria bacterium]
MPTGRFEGRVAVVTGGASGIGLAIVRRFLTEGGRVVACDVDADRLGAMEGELGADLLAVRADVTREAEVAALFDRCVERFGAVHCAFAVAGASRPAHIVDMPEADWDFTVDLCLKGVMLTVKHAARRMIAQGNNGGSANGVGGAIVSIASLNAHVPMHAGAAYASAKAGVEMLTKNAALELAEDGIRVNAVLPGLVQTPLTRRHFENERALAAFKERIPMGRAAQPEEIAGPALYLASDDASYVSGAGLLVDGAWAVSGYPDTRPWRGRRKFGTDPASEP